MKTVNIKLELMISLSVDFMTNMIARGKKRRSHMVIKETIHLEDMTIINVYTTNDCLKIHEEIESIRGEIDSTNILLVNISASVVDITLR